MSEERGHGIVVAHPGVQHSYETALAVQEAGLLRRYVTGFYYDPEMPLGRLLRSLPPGVRGRIDGELSRRRKPGLDPARVQSVALWDVVRMVITSTGRMPSWAIPVVTLAGRRFDRVIPRVLAATRPAAVIAYDTSALGAFQAAKRLGIRCILDHSIAHPRVGQRLLEEERELHPEWTDSLMLEADPGPRLARCDAELALADQIIAGSEYVRTTLAAEGVDAGKVFVNPYGADLDRFRPAAREKDGVFRILFVGQVTQRKGLTYLFDAVRRMTGQPVELVIVGKVVGSGRALARYADVFRHVGGVAHAEIHHWFQRSDVFVYPSLHEGSALAIYEAMASGVPVVTTPNSGSVVRDGIEGFIVPIRDADAIYTALGRLRDDEDLRRSMGAEARRRSESYSWSGYRRRLGAALTDWIANDDGDERASAEPRLQKQAH